MTATPTSLLAAGLATVLVALALLHLYWMVRGVGTGTAVPTRTDGTPLFRPGRVASLTVALALGAAALLVLLRARLIDLGLPLVMVRLGTWGVAVAFAARTVGDFHFVGLFKSVRGTPFARWDDRLFTPLCLAIALATAILATTTE